MYAVRRGTPDDIPAIAALTADTFVTPEERDATIAAVHAGYAHSRRMRVDRCYVATDDEGVVGSCQMLDLEIRLCETWVPCAGALAVAVAPRARNPRRVVGWIREAREDLRTLGYPLVLGFAQRGALYRKLGGVPFQAENTLELAPEVVREPPVRAFREMSPDDLPAVVAWHEAGNAHRAGTVRRTVQDWPLLPRIAREVYVADDGYLGVLRHEDALEIRDAEGASPTFYADALRYACALAREAGLERVFGHIPPDHPLALVGRPWGAAHTTAWHRREGPMVAVEDVDGLLRAVQPGLDTRFRAVHPDRGMCLEVACGREIATLQLGDGESQRVRIDLPAGELARMLFGTVGLESLVASGGATFDDPVAAAWLAPIFPAGHPFTWRADRF